MFVAYDGIVFDLLFLDGWQVESDMSSDGVDFLRWHHIIDVTCVLNQSATAAWKFPKSEGFNDQINKGIVTEAVSRLRSKGNIRGTGQKAGEDQLKSQRKELSSLLSSFPCGMMLS